ncbi:MAG TPA: hypothetical protein VMU22_04705 [Rhizomicrobium sp.]|nr:hypothetical protein [Rhizomicrobium sp.]
MRNSRLLLCSVAAMALANPVWAQGASKAGLPPASGLPDDAAADIVPFVSPGDQIGIACVALNKSSQQSDVRVVLTIAAEPGDTPPGYHRVLATDEQVAHGAVRVKIPTVPDLEDHLVNVDVYVVGDKSEQSCDAGQMKIVRQRIASAPGAVG